MSDKKTNYDIESNSGRGIKWNAGSYVKSTDGTLHLKGVELDFKNSSDTVVFTVDTDGNVDITGAYKVNGTPIGTGGSLDINALTAKTTPVDADLGVIADSAASFANKKVTWANIKATLKTYLDTLYVALANFVTGSTDNAILRANGTGGGTSQGSGILIDDSNNFVLPTTAAASQTGIIYKGSTPFIHNYKGNASSNGFNLFFGESAGNFTLDWNGSQAFTASLNIGIGYQSLSALTTGYSNVTLGYQSGNAITTGANNFAMGTSSLQKITTGSNSAVIGSESGRYTTGAANTLFGTQSGLGVSGSSTYANCVGVGFQALKSVTTGHRNIAIGYQANTLTTTGTENIMIGYQVNPSSDTAANEINIGNRIFAGRSGSPESVVTANVGSMYLRSDGGAGTTLYIKESGSGNTGWIAK